MCPQRIIFPALEALFREFKVLFHQRPPPWRRGTAYHTIYQMVIAYSSPTKARNRNSAIIL